MGPTWRVYDEDGDPEITGTPRPLLVTARSLGDALRRSWRVWVGAALVGGLLGVGALFAMPRPASATTTLFMVHPDASDPGAMTTDISLLQTRAVASRVLADLDLSESPAEFLSTVTAEPLNSQVLLLTVTGPTDEAAVARASSLIDNFLQFRAQQLRSVSDGIVAGYEKRVAALQAEAASLTAEYNRLDAEPGSDPQRASEIISARAAIGAQVTEMQRSIESAGLATDAAVTATHIIDLPEATARGSKRQVVLFGLSGALLGAAVAMVTVLFRTLTSNRLRRRHEVASALGVPVRVGVGPVPRQGLLFRAEAAVAAGVARLFRGHPVRWTPRRRNRNLEALVQGLESALPSRVTDPPERRSAQAKRPRSRPSGATTLGLAAIDRPETGALIVCQVGRRLADRGVPVLLVDLSATGSLLEALGVKDGSPIGLPESLRVHRPDGDPTLAQGPRRAARRPATSVAPELDELGAMWDEAEVVLALVEVDPGIDLGILRSWVNRVVPLVTAGRASHELLTTISGLAAAAQVDLPFALVDGVDRSDESFGLSGVPRAETPSGVAEHQ